MKKIFLIAILQVLTVTLIAQEIGNFNQKFSNSTVKYLDFNLSKDAENALKNNSGASSYLELFSGISDFFSKNYSLSGSILTEDQRTNYYGSLNSVCQVAYLQVEVGEFVSQFLAVGYYPLTMKFTFCDGSEFSFKNQINVNGNTRSFYRPVQKTLNEIFVVKPIPSNQKNELVLKKAEKVYSKAEIESLASSSDSKINGIYEIISSSSRLPLKRIAILSSGSELKLIHLEGKYFKDDWEEGELRGEFIALRKDSIYKGILLGNLKTEVEFSLLLSEDGFLELEKMDSGEKFKFVKIEN